MIITYSGIWTKIDISKNMDGAIYSPTQELLMAMKENAGTSISLDTGIDFASASSASNDESYVTDCPK